MAVTSILIANRGEVAVRLIRACHDEGLDAVAVYSDVDRDAPHVRVADKAIHIGPAEAAASYLNGEALIKAAQTTGADAIHPGYGFLAENADFAQACIDAGLTFVGPKPTIIRQMGSKIAAKAAAEAAGIPVIPGYHVDGTTDAELTAAAGRIGAPLLIKASAGGGGRGMRQIDDLEDFADQLILARQEAGAAFGDDAVLLEHYVPQARHVEVQILGDGRNNTVHLFERDCSIQRHHQKVIEEAPAPNLPDIVRTAMLDAAVKLAHAIGYDSAGTVEFIYDAATEEFYFLEMNTRLQVEHPVTEMVTGIDIVGWQLRIAGGAALTLAQSDIRCDGWAMEARLAAEDPAANFRPKTGEITDLAFPAGDSLRVDSGIATGVTVGHYYDSMLAKVIAFGRDRATARRRLWRALDETRLGGVDCNLGFLCSLLDLPAFLSGTHHTGLLKDTWPEGWRCPPLTDDDRASAVVAALLAARDGDPADASPWQSLGAWRITTQLGRPGTTTRYLRDDSGALTAATVADDGAQITVRLNDTYTQVFDAADWSDGVLEHTHAGQTETRTIWVRNGSVTLWRGGNMHRIEVLAPEDALLGAPVETASDDVAVTAPMPGLVTDVRVRPGDTVTAGDTVLVLEAMKLLQDLKSPRDATVLEVRHRAGDTVDGGAILVTFGTRDP